MSQLTINSDNQVKSPNRIQANWGNMSTAGKIAVVAVSIVLLGAAVAAFIWGGPLLTTMLHLSPETSALILHSTVAGLAALGLMVPTCSLLRSSKQPKPIEPSRLQNAWGTTKSVMSHTKDCVVSASESFAAWLKRHREHKAL